MAAFMILLGVVALTALTSVYYYGTNIEEGRLYNTYLNNRSKSNNNTIRHNNTIDDNKYIFETGSQNPKLWLYYDQSEVNSRYWSDFGARSSRVLNAPFLNLCYESIVMKNGQNYTVNIIAGLSDLAILLGGWQELPKSLQNPIAPVGEAELNYIRSTVLRRFGGLWVNPSCLFIRPLLKLSNKVVFFGTDKDETYSDVYGTPVPGTDIMFSPAAENPIFIELEHLALERIEKREGGRQFRKDIKWDMKDIMDKHHADNMYLPNTEFARKSNGKRIQLEDLLGSNDIHVNEDCIYIPFDWEELQKRRNFGWFLRMSETQILESNLYISRLFLLSTIN